MYGKPWNHKAPFGEIYGDNRFFFDQDGQLYNAQKQPVDGNGTLMPLPPTASKPEPAKPAAAVSAPQPADDDDTPADEKPFDLVAWARGDELLKATPWAVVRAAVATEFDDMSAITGKDAARRAILEKYGAKT